MNSEGPSDQYEIPDPYADLPDTMAARAEEALKNDPEAQARGRDEEHRRYIAQVNLAKRFRDKLAANPEQATDAEWRAANRQYDEAWRNLLDYEDSQGYREDN